MKFLYVARRRTKKLETHAVIILWHAPNSHGDPTRLLISGSIDPFTGLLSNNRASSGYVESFRLRFLDFRIFFVKIDFCCVKLISGSPEKPYEPRGTEKNIFFFGRKTPICLRPVFLIFFSFSDVSMIIQRAAELRTRHRALNFWFFDVETLVF